MTQPSSPYQHKIFTIPNLLSLIRLVMIPLIMHAYCIQQSGTATAVLLILSGLTDTVDGFIARRFNMISDLGKALDPVADKLTQGAMLLCLISRFPLMLAPFVVLVIKEICVGLTSLWVIRKTGAVHGAVWHGKVTTCLLYALMILHVLWPAVPAALSTGMIILCAAMMLLSFLLYVLRNLHLAKQ